MRTLVGSGSKGFVGHESIPTRDPREGIAQAIAVCDV
jgi:hydroxypyruvate isomerase